MPSDDKFLNFLGVQRFFEVPCPRWLLNAVTSNSTSNTKNTHLKQEDWRRCCCEVVWRNSTKTTTQKKIICDNRPTDFCVLVQTKLPTRTGYATKFFCLAGLGLAGCGRCRLRRGFAMGSKKARKWRGTYTHRIHVCYIYHIYLHLVVFYEKLEGSTNIAFSVFSKKLDNCFKSNRHGQLALQPFFLTGCELRIKVSQMLWFTPLKFEPMEFLKSCGQVSWVCLVSWVK